LKIACSAHVVKPWSHPHRNRARSNDTRLVGLAL